MKLSKYLRTTWSGLLDLLFPPHCVGCSREGAWLCASCLAKIEYLRPPLCPICGRAVEQEGLLCPICQARPLLIHGIRSVAYLEGPLREAIHAFKYKGVRVLAPTLGQILVTYWSDHPRSTDVIVPVPLHPSRARQRGYNQSALLARELAQQIGLPMVGDCLHRIRATRPQVGLKARERWENVAHAFDCRDDRLTDRNILLIDDVCTTGATLAACARALYNVGAKKVWALTLARER